MKSIGIEELALLLSWISVISSDENRGRSSGCYSSSTRDGVVYARVVISKSESSSEPGPLHSVITIGKVGGNSDSEGARSRATIGRSRISSVGIGRIIGMTSTDFVATDLLYSGIKSSMRVRLTFRGPSESNKSSSMVISRPLNADSSASLNLNGSSSGGGKISIARSEAIRSSASGLSLCLVTSRCGFRQVRVSVSLRNKGNEDESE